MDYKSNDVTVEKNKKESNNVVLTYANAWMDYMNKKKGEEKDA